MTVLFVGYFLTTGTRFLDSEGAANIFRVLALALFITNIALDRVYRYKHLLYLLILSFLLALNQSVIGLNIVFLILVIISLNRLSNRDISAVLLMATLAVVGIHLLFLILGILETQSTEFSGRTRSTLGFSNANQVSSIYLSLVLVSSFAQVQMKSKLSTILLLFSYAIALYFLAKTDSRTAQLSIYILVFTQFSSLFLFRLRLYRTVLVLLGATTPIVGAILTYYLTVTTSTALNHLLSLRPYFFSEFMRGITVTDFLLGWQNPGEFGVDNSYLMMLSAVGAFVLSLILVGMSYAIFRMDRRIVPLVVVILISGIFESFLLRPEIPLAVLFAVLMTRRRLIDARSSFVAPA